jgi:hypothetical protein
MGMSAAIAVDKKAASRGRYRRIKLLSEECPLEGDPFSGSSSFTRPLL